MIGVVLCGGQSKRMGTDKAQLPFSDKTWAEMAYTKLQQLQMPVYLSVNAQQVAFFNQLFSPNTLVVDDVNLSIGGPLLGLLSVHQLHPNETILLLACDMPNITTEALLYLQQASNNSHSEAIVFNNNGQLEPLCAIYSAKGLQKIMQQYLTNSLSRHSMHFVLNQLQTATLEVPDTWQHYFVNVNSKSDLGSL